jgi:high-affinity nickel-transport protein
MVERADRRARVASRVMGLAIALLGIGIASLGMARLLSTQAAKGLGGAELPMGFGVAILVVTSFAVAMRLARPGPA